MNRLLIASYKISGLWIRAAVCFCFLCFPLAGLVSAADVSFQANVDRKSVRLGEVIQLSLSFYGAQNIDTPVLEDIEGFDVRYLGPSTRMSIVNGRSSSSITHIYSLIPLKTGRFTIGPFSAEVNGNVLTSKPITIEVLSASQSRGQSGQKKEDDTRTGSFSREELKDHVFLLMESDKKSAYVNDIIGLTIKLYVSGVPVRDIQYPRLETAGFSIDDFQEPNRYRENLNGMSYEVVEFKTDIFALKPGEFVLGPVSLRCNLMFRKQSSRKRRSPFDDDFFGSLFDGDAFGGFFGGYQSYPLELESAPLPVTIMSFPQDDKPDNFKGTVGDFDLEIEARPAEVKAGDPITLNIIVSGRGNFDTVSSPELKSQDGFKVYDPQVKQGRNTKVFEQVVIPQSQEVKSIPGITFSFFNPAVGRYETITKGPFPIRVTKAEQTQAKVIEGEQGRVKAVIKEKLGRDLIYIKSSPGRLRSKGSYFYNNLTFWIVQIVIAFAFAGILTGLKHRQRLKTDIIYARSLRAPAKAKKGLRRLKQLMRSDKKDEFFDRAFITMRDYLADRLRLPAGAVTLSEVTAILSKKKVEQRIVDKLGFIFEHCDIIRYSPDSNREEIRQDIYKNLKEAVDYLERRKL